jgi:hypothetical protein
VIPVTAIHANQTLYGGGIAIAMLPSGSSPHKLKAPQHLFERRILRRANDGFFLRLAYQFQG